MRIAEVIGTVTLSRCHPSITGYRWIVGVPFSLKALKNEGPPDGDRLRTPESAAIGEGMRIGGGDLTVLLKWTPDPPRSSAA